MVKTEYSLQTGYRLENSGTDEDTTRSVEHGPREMEEMASRITLERIVSIGIHLRRSRCYPRSQSRSRSHLTEVSRWVRRRLFRCGASRYWSVPLFQRGMSAEQTEGF